MPEMEKNEVLKIYKSVGALLEGHFILSSGLHSKVYLQSALIFSDPVIAKVICKKLVELIKTNINVNQLDIIISTEVRNQIFDGREDFIRNGAVEIFEKNNSLD